MYNLEFCKQQFCFVSLICLNFVIENQKFSNFKATSGNVQVDQERLFAKYCKF